MNDGCKIVRSIIYEIARKTEDIIPFFVFLFSKTHQNNDTAGHMSFMGTLSYYILKRKRNCYEDGNPYRVQCHY